MNPLVQFTKYQQSLNFSTTTINKNCRNVNRFRLWMKKNNSNKELRNVTPQDILNYVKFLKKSGIQPITINRNLGSVKHYYNSLNVKRNPCQNIKIGGVKQYVVKDILTPEELLEMYLKFPADTTQNMRNKVLFGLYAFQGLYATEPDTLRTSQIDFQKGTIEISPKQQLNGRVLKMESMQMFDLYRYVHEIRPVLLEETKNYIRLKRKQESDLAEKLFFTLHNLPHLSNTRIDLCAQLKSMFPRFVNLPQLRASVIVYWLQSNNLRIVAHLSGHKYVSSTERFKSADIAKLQQAVLKNHPLQ